MSQGFKLVESDVWPGCRQIEVEGELDVHGQVRRLLALTGLGGQELRIGPDPDGTRYRGAEDAAALIPG